MAPSSSRCRKISSWKGTFLLLFLPILVVLAHLPSTHTHTHTKEFLRRRLKHKKRARQTTAVIVFQTLVNTCQNSYLRLSREVGEDGRPPFALLVSHPHPKLGGDYDNNVTVALAETLVTNPRLQLSVLETNWILSLHPRLYPCSQADRGMTTLRFNTRGIGRSTGSSTFGGNDEVDDFLACILFLTDPGSSMHRRWPASLACFQPHSPTHPPTPHTRTHVAGQ